MGVFTPSEIGAFAVVYAIFIGVLIYRKMKSRGFLEALEGSLSDVVSVMSSSRFRRSSATASCLSGRRRLSPD